METITKESGAVMPARAQSAVAGLVQAAPGPSSASADLASARRGARQLSHVPHRSEPATRVNVNDTERALSGALGALLLAGGLKGRSGGAVAAGVLGGALLYRGLSGHCHVYQALHF